MSGNSFTPVSQRRRRLAFNSELGDAVHGDAPDLISNRIGDE
jgi:hypothetical protein